jgi:DNA-binding beta-propeller fold protein YncE
MKPLLRACRRERVTPRFVLLALCLACPPALSAQAEADSARVAREAWRQAVPLFRRQEYAAARELMRRAYLAWPSQPVYVAGYAAVSARVLDTAATLEALTLLADLGLSADLDGAEFAGLRAAPALREVARRLAANAAPMAESAVALTLAEPDFFPEGISHDPRSGAWYVGSIRRRKVTRVLPGGAAEDLVREGQDGLWSVLGVRADPVRSTLWVTTAAIPQGAGYLAADSGRSGIYAFDLGTGRLKGRYLLPNSPAGHLLGDLVVAANGDVYATDSRDPVIWRIRSGAEEAQEFLRHPLFRSLQGPALEPSGRTLYVADYSHGVLAVDLNTRQVRVLPAPPRTTVLGIDGLTWYAGSLIAIQNGVSLPRVLRLQLDGPGQRILGVTVLDRNLTHATEPTIGTVWERRYFYVANSQWEAYDDGGRLRPGVRLMPPRILEIKLP